MRFKITICVTLFLFINGVYAQTLDDKNDAILAIAGDTAITDIVDAFEAFRGPLYSDPGLPAFTLVSKNRKVAAGIGGYIRLTASVDFNGIIENRDFIPYLIPVPNSAAQRSRFVMDPSSSRLFLRLLAETKWGLMHLYLDTDFRALNNRNRYTYAYLELQGWQVGRLWSLIADLDSYPPSIDFQGPNAFCGTPTFQLSYQRKLASHLSFGIGLELPDYSIADSLESYRTTQRIPSFPAYLKLAGNYGHIRFSTIFRPLTYKNPLTGHTKQAITWGTVLSSVLLPSSKLTFYLQGVYGQGIANYIFELNGFGLDLTSNPHDPGKLQPLNLWGGFLGFQYQFTDKLKTSAIYSQLRLLQGDYYVADRYRFGQYVAATLYYSLTPKLQLAFEYNYGHVEHQNRLHAKANRLQSMIRYDF